MAGSVRHAFFRLDDKYMQYPSLRASIDPASLIWQIIAAEKFPLAGWRKMKEKFVLRAFAGPEAGLVAPEN